MATAWEGVGMAWDAAVEEWSLITRASNPLLPNRRSPLRHPRFPTALPLPTWHVPKCLFTTAWRQDDTQRPVEASYVSSKPAAVNLAQQNKDT